MISHVLHGEQTKIVDMTLLHESLRNAMVPHTYEKSNTRISTKTGSELTNMRYGVVLSTKPVDHDTIEEN